MTDRDTRATSLDHQLERLVHDWLDEVIEPLPPRIRDEVVVQAAVIAQQGRWPWQRRGAERTVAQRLALAPLVAVLAAAMAVVLGLYLATGEPHGPTPALLLAPSQGPLASAAASPEARIDEDTETREIVVSRRGDGDGSSITAAIALAQAGDTIRVLPGVFAEDLVIDKDVDIVGDGSRDGIVISGSVEWVGVDGSMTGLVVDGPVRIRSGASPTLQANDLRQGLAIADAGSLPLIEQNFIRDVSEGIRVLDGAEPKIIENDVSTWPGQELDTSSISISGAGGDIRDNVVHGSDIGIGVYLGWPGISGNTIRVHGIGLYIRCARPLTVDNRIEGNHVGVELEDGCAEVDTSERWSTAVHGNEICDNAEDVVVPNEADFVAANFVCSQSRAGDEPLLRPLLKEPWERRRVQWLDQAPQPPDVRSVPEPGTAAELKLEQVEPHVFRFVDDGAGHDASDIPTSAKWLYKLTVAPDGTVWIPRLDEILHLGAPGLVENPIGPGALELEVEADGRLWIRNGPVATPDGKVLGERTDPARPRVVELVAHPDGGMIASLAYAGDRNELRHWTVGMDSLGPLVAPPRESAGTGWELLDVTVATDGMVWAIERRYWPETQERLPARLVRTDGVEWEVYPLEATGEAVEPWAIGQAADGRMFVDWVATGSEPGSDPGDRIPISQRGVGRWLAELGPDGGWTRQPIEEEGSDPGWRAMAGVTPGRAWFPLGDAETCRGVAALTPAIVEHYLTDKCVYGLAVAPDHRVWATASDHGGYNDIDSAALYVITPQQEAEGDKSE